MDNIESFLDFIGFNKPVQIEDDNFVKVKVNIISETGLKENDQDEFPKEAKFQIFGVL